MILLVYLSDECDPSSVFVDKKNFIPYVVKASTIAVLHGSKTCTERGICIGMVLPSLGLLVGGGRGGG